MDDELPKQSLMQKQITFANNAEMAQAAIQILKDSFVVSELVGDSEYSTVVNAVRMDTQQNVMLSFLKRLEFIQQGGLINTQRS